MRWLGRTLGGLGALLVAAGAALPWIAIPGGFGAPKTDYLDKTPLHKNLFGFWILLHDTVAKFKQDDPRIGYLLVGAAAAMLLFSFFPGRAKVLLVIPSLAAGAIGLLTLVHLMNIIDIAKKQGGGGAGLKVGFVGPIVAIGGALLGVLGGIVSPAGAGRRVVVAQPAWAGYGQAAGYPAGPPGAMPPQGYAPQPPYPPQQPPANPYAAPAYQPPAPPPPPAAAWQPPPPPPVAEPEPEYEPEPDAEYAPEPDAAPAPSGSDVYDQLRLLSELKASGQIDEAAYEARKAELLREI